MPALVVHTTLDHLVTPSLQRDLAAGIPGVRETELGSGHLPFAEAPDAWSAAVLDFLGEVNA